MSVLNTQKFLTTTTGVTLALGSLLAFGQSALAESRPVNFGTNSETSLQELLDGITVGGPGIDTVNDQTDFNYFTNQASGVSVGSLMFELTGFAENNQFGIYQYGNPLKKAVLFDGVNDSGDSVLVNFLDNDSISVVTQQFAPDASDPTPVFILLEDFGNVFGFYLTNADGKTFYTDDALNPGEKAQALIYQGDDETVLDIPGKQPGTFSDNEFIIAFDDFTRDQGSDSDFNDFVVMFESIEPASIPEPTAIAGLGLIAGSLAMTRRRKSNKNSRINQ